MRSDRIRPRSALPRRRPPFQLDDDELIERTLAYVRPMAGYTRTGLTMTKEVLWHNVDNPNMAAAIAIENRNQSIAGRAPDVIEYMRGYRARTTGGGTAS